MTAFDFHEVRAAVTAARAAAGAASGPQAQTVVRAVSAPGKAMLIGEYAVLAGAEAIVAAVDARAYAHAARAELSEREAARSGVVAAVCELATQLDLPVPSSLPRVDTSAMRWGARKLGLGSSASVAAVIAGWLLARAGVDLVGPAGRSAALALASRAHADAQQGGSGADVAASVLGGFVGFRAGRARPMDRPRALHARLVDAGAPAETSAFLRRLQRAKEDMPAAHDAAIACLSRASARFVDAWISAVDDDAPIEMGAIETACAEHVEGLAALDALLAFVSSSLGADAGARIVTPAIADIVALASAHGVAAKPSGAGGGDLVVVFSDDEARLDHFGIALRERTGRLLLPGLALGAGGLRTDAHVPTGSRLAKLFAGDAWQRRARVSEAAGIDPTQLAALDAGAFAIDRAQHMIENVIGTLALPVGVATNFVINGREVLVPMCVEEASVVAAASNAAKMVREGGGFRAVADPPWMIGQVQLLRRSGACSALDAIKRVDAARRELLALADASHPRLCGRGGGARDLDVRVLDEDMIVVHVVVDCRDAMGANLINTVAEAIAPELERRTGWRAGLRILSNLTDRRCVTVECAAPFAALAGGGHDGAVVAAAIVDASRFAELDPYRAATHNKGMMNGIDAVVLATGNDWRAIEAGVHAFAAQSGRYGPLCTWRIDDEAGALVGRARIPLAVGTVGGATMSHPAARAALAVLGEPSAADLAQIIASVGVASNLAALRALATEGIQRGHMSLHARSVALAAGAESHEIDLLARVLVEVREIKPDRALSLLAQIRAGTLPAP